jgi:transposase
MGRFGLRDDQWHRIKDILPGRKGHVGGTAADNRLFVEAVLYRFRTGVPWRDLPARFGHWKSVHATIVRAHQHNAGAQKKVTKRSVDRAADSPRKSMRSSTHWASLPT